MSAADPSDILRNIKVVDCRLWHSVDRALFTDSFLLSQDMDDMDADLFPLKKKPGSAPPQTKLSGNEASNKDSTVLDGQGAGSQSCCMNYLHLITCS